MRATREIPITTTNTIHKWLDTGAHGANGATTCANAWSARSVQCTSVLRALNEKCRLATVNLSQASH